MTTMQQVADGQTYPEVPINENFDAVSAFALFARRHAATSGLVWAYYGGYYDSTLIADDDVTLSDGAANYVVVERATGVVSVDTATTDWNDTTDFGRLYKVTTSAGAITAVEDHRFGASGILTSSGGGAVDIVNGLTGTVVLTAKDISIADSDSRYAGATIEEALEEVGASIAGLATPTAAQVIVADSDSAFAGASVEEALEEIAGVSILQGDGLTATKAGFRGIPQNAQAGNYTLVAADAGKHIFHASGDGAGDTYTIPANSSVAFPVGTAVTFANLDSNAVTIAITTDTMYLGGTGTTGSRTLAQYGVATALKLTSTAWVISGPGLT